MALNSLTPHRPTGHCSHTPHTKPMSQDTCAADGMCQEKCPVKINTGDLIKHIRTQEMEGSPRSSAAAK